MNRVLPILIITAMFLACNSEPDQKKETVITPPAVNWFDTDTLIVWNCDAAAEQRTRIFSPPDSVSLIQPFLNGINKTWPEAQLVLQRQSNDTIVVSISNSQWLNSRMGNSGAEQYLTFAALNLLEVKGVHYVTFDIPRGVHAGPSTWSHADFADWKTDSTNIQP